MNIVRSTTPSGGSASTLNLRPQIDYSGGDRGWVGDNPFIFLDCSRMRALGWKPKLTIREGIVRTLEYLEQNQFLLEAR